MELIQVYDRILMISKGLSLEFVSGTEAEGIFNQSFSMAEHIFYNWLSTLWYISFTGNSSNAPQVFSL